MGIKSEKLGYALLSKDIEEKLEYSSVFEVMDEDHPDILSLKSTLMIAITEIIRENGWSKKKKLQKFLRYLSQKW